jgi:hypothetical protein
MRSHAVGQTPFRFATGAEVIVTGFRGYDATVALCQAGETGITETLAETFAGATPAMYAFNLLQVFDLDSLSEIIAERHSLATELETVTNRIAVCSMHLVKITLKLYQLCTL